MNPMFLLCLSIQEFNLTNFDTENVKDMDSLFGGLTVQKDLSSFSSENLETMNYMFQYYFDLKIIKFSQKFSSDHIAFMYRVFDCATI